MGEMKAYIGGDETTEQAQRMRGFKSYRDFYAKRLMEHEHHSKALQEQKTQVDVISCNLGEIFVKH